jgi:hypothetical protein
MKLTVPARISDASSDDKVLRGIMESLTQDAAAMDDNARKLSAVANEVRANPGTTTLSCRQLEKQAARCAVAAARLRTAAAAVHQHADSRA